MTFNTEEKATISNEWIKARFVTNKKIFTQDNIKETYHNYRLEQSKWAF